MKSLDESEINNRTAWVNKELQKHMPSFWVWTFYLATVVDPDGHSEVWNSW